MAENLALNKIPLVRAPGGDGTIVKRKTFGRQEERRSTTIIDTIKRSKIDKPTLKATKTKATSKSSTEGQKKTESISDSSSLPKSAAKESDSASNSTSGSPIEGILSLHIKFSLLIALKSLCFNACQDTIENFQQKKKLGLLLTALAYILPN